MFQHPYRLIVHHQITTSKLHTNNTLQQRDCIWTSPVFLWDGSLTALDTIIDHYQELYNRHIDSATVSPI